MTFIVAGTGRSGTKWCATVMRNAGILCGHEQVHRTGMLRDHEPPVWGDFEGDASLAAVPYLDEHDGPKVLVVRHPLSVIGSFLRVGPLLAGSQPHVEYLRVWMPDVFKQGNERDAAAYYWLAWNGWAADHSDTILRLEGMNPERLFKACGVAPRWPTFPLGAVNRQQEGRNLADPEWDDIRLGLRGDVKRMAESFGYEV